jgi:aminomuconate-semialdehyde/2-hydroxymuconate-6-semialdehyde dehydrogenase
MKILNYINGQLQPAQGGAWLDNYEPATGSIYSQLPDSDETDIALATDAAHAAFPAWSKTPVSERAALLSRLADLIERDMDKLAAAESRDQGKPVALAKRMDIPRAVDNFRFFATAIQHYASEAHSTDGAAINYTLRQPIGVVGCISPWNLPLYLFSWKIAPALAAGNTVVAKPSEITPMTAFLLCELCIEAGFPKGVLNIVFGLGPKVGQAMSAHPGIPAISFTGGTVTGATIARTAAPMFKKLSLELGGKNPNIIFADADYDKALASAVRSSFTNQGEICLCGSRLLIERSIYDRFRDDFVAKVAALRVGDPTTNPDLGAIVSKQHFEKVLGYIQLAQEEGGKLLTGGKAVTFSGRCENGWFIQPTVFEGLPNSCRTNQEEIFGPVVTLMPFDTEAEALAMANDTPYGLAAQLWTENLSRSQRMSATLKFGIVWVNCWLLRDLRTPFGGAKASGVGREGGWDALRFFTEATNVCIRY